MNRATKILQQIANPGIDNKIKNTHTAIPQKKNILKPTVAKPKSYVKPKAGV